MTQSDFEKITSIVSASQIALFVIPHSQSVNPDEYKVSSFSEYFNEQHSSVWSNYT